MVILLPLMNEKQMISVKEMMKRFFWVETISTSIYLQNPLQKRVMVGMKPNKDYTLYLQFLILQNLQIELNKFPFLKNHSGRQK